MDASGGDRYVGNSIKGKKKGRGWDCDGEREGEREGEVGMGMGTGSERYDQVIRECKDLYLLSCKRLFATGILDIFVLLF